MPSLVGAQQNDPRKPNQQLRIGMIIHRLITHHLRHGDDTEFYRIQATDAIDWLAKQGIQSTSHPDALDLGCGHGVFGRELQTEGHQVVFADQTNELLEDLSACPFVKIDLDQDSFESLSQRDLVICSNVLEHLAHPDRFLQNCRSILKPNGYLYLSWTNWLSPWGGHDFSPFHYLGPRWGHRVYDRIIGKKRIHTPFVTLYPTYIGPLIHQINSIEGLRVVKTIPRYYSELSWLMKVPLLREFTAWNCAMLIQRR